MDRSRAAVRAVVDTNVVAYLLLGVRPFASRERLPLATFDTKLLTVFSAIAKRPGVLLPK